MDLFEKTKIKNMILSNRFFKSASWEALATESGHMTDELFDIYEELAKGGVGAIFTGYAYVTQDEKPNPGMMGIYDDSFIDEYKKLTQIVHKYSTNIIMQIAYGGSMSTLNPPSKKIFAPSSVENERTKIIPTEMTKDDMKYIKDCFVNAAVRVQKAQFDAVELHVAHGYMLSQFLSPHYNKRTDGYGGSIENRTKFIVEIIQDIRFFVGNDFPIMIKINSDDFMSDGLNSEESIIASKIFEDAGVDAIEVSGGNESSLEVLNSNKGPARTKISSNPEDESYFKEHAKKLSKQLKIPVILTGGNRDYNVMESILKTSDVDYFGLCRPLICQPNLISLWSKSIEKSRSNCISCNQCYYTHGKRCAFAQKNK